MKDFDNEVRGYRCKGLQVVTVSVIQPLYKDGKKAKNVELISFRETDKTFVAKKGYYKLMDRAFLIPEDYCVPNNELFKSYIELYGRKDKSYLEKVNGVPSRVVPIKFKLSLFQYLYTEDDTVTSNCILIPLADMIWYLKKIKANFYGKSLNQIAAQYIYDIGIYEYAGCNKEDYKPKRKNIFVRIWGFLTNKF
jgi:hypothetical protein